MAKKDDTHLLDLLNSVGRRAEWAVKEFLVKAKDKHHELGCELHGDLMGRLLTQKAIVVLTSVLVQLEDTDALNLTEYSEIMRLPSGSSTPSLHGTILPEEMGRTEVNVARQTRPNNSAGQGSDSEGTAVKLAN